MYPGQQYGGQPAGHGQPNQPMGQPPAPMGQQYPGGPTGYAPTPGDPGAGMGAGPSPQLLDQAATLTGPPPKAHAPLYVLVILVVAALFGSLVGFGAAVAFDDSVDISAKRALRERATEPGTVGKEIIDELAAFTVNDFTCGVSIVDERDDLPYEPSDDMQYCAANITIKNRSDEHEYLSLLVALDPGNRESPVEYNSLLSMYYTDPQGGTTFDSDLSGNESVDYGFVFEVPLDASPKALELNDNRIEGKGVTVNLD